MDFAALAELCAPTMGAETLSSIVAVESSGNPYAIGIVGGHLRRQPQSLSEAVATADMLEASGYNYSLGLAQINRAHFQRFGMTPASAFDPCLNARASAVIWNDCVKRAGGAETDFGDALSCYNSGNLTTGYRNGYVTRVLKARAAISGGVEVVSDTTGTRTRKSAPRPPERPSEALLTASTAKTPDKQAQDTTALLF